MKSSAAPMRQRTDKETCELTGMTPEQLEQARRLAGIPEDVVDVLKRAYSTLGLASPDYEELEGKAPEEITAFILRQWEQIRTSTKKPRGLSHKTRELRAAILAAFEETDKPVTVRQMFYMLSVRNAVAKTEAGYRQVQRQLVEMRRDMEVPYAWLADNTRWMRKPTAYRNIEDFFDKAQKFYRQDLWANQDAYVEVWCEKDALAGVLYPITAEYDVPLMVARGYSSESFAYEAAENIRECGKPAFVYYLGDFDPSGWHMATNLESKLKDFGAEIDFVRLAVNPEQIKAWSLPTRPTKETDTRCKAFFDLYGHGTPSVELDAIPPDTLRQMVREAVENHIDVDAHAALRREEKAAQESLSEFITFSQQRGATP